MGWVANTSVAPWPSGPPMAASIASLSSETSAVRTCAVADHHRLGDERARRGGVSMSWGAMFFPLDVTIRSFFAR